MRACKPIPAVAVLPRICIDPGLVPRPFVRWHVERVLTHAKPGPRAQSSRSSAANFYPSDQHIRVLSRWDKWSPKENNFP